MSSAPKIMKKQQMLFSPVKKVVGSNKGEDFTSGFDVIKQLGEGNFGIVNAVKRRSDGKMFAEKVYTSGAPDMNEVDILSRIDHPNVLKASAKFIDDKGVIHILLPLADTDLEEYIRTTPSVLNDPRQLNKVIYMMYELISAADFLHAAGVYHCDIKPPNVLIKDGHVLLADFGWAYPQDFDTENTCGSVGYASPQGWREHPKKDSYYDGKLNQIQSDIHALGATFYEMLTAKKLIWPSNPLMMNRKTFDKAYKEAEQQLQKVKKDVTDNSNYTEDQIKLIVEALNCIEIMIKPKQEDRFKSLKEVLNCRVFKKFGGAIQGSIKQISIDDINCDKYQDVNMEKIIFQIMSYVMMFYNKHKHMNLLKVWCLTLSLIYRTINKVQPAKDKLICFGFACYYVAAFTVMTEPIDIYSLSKEANDMGHLCPVSQILSMINKIIVGTGGIINMETIYDKTDNAVEILWWLMNATGNCKFALNSFQNLDNQHAAFNLDEYRFPFMNKKSFKIDILRFNSLMTTLTIETNNKEFFYSIFENKFKLL